MKPLSFYMKHLRRVAAAVLCGSVALLPAPYFVSSARAADTSYPEPKEIKLYRWTEVQSIDNLDTSGDGVTQVMALLDHQYVKDGQITENGYILDLNSMLKEAQSGTNTKKYGNDTWDYWKYKNENGSPKVYLSSDMDKAASHDSVACYSIKDDDLAGTKLTDPQIDTSKEIFYTDKDYPCMLVKSVPIDFASSRVVFNGNDSITMDIKSTKDGKTFYDTNSNNRAYTFSIGIGDGQGGDTGWYLNEKRSHLVFAPVGQNDGVSCEEQDSTEIIYDEGQRPWCFKFYGKRVGLFVNIVGRQDAAIQKGDKHHVKYKWSWTDSNLMKFILYKRTELRMSALDGDLTVTSSSPFRSQNFLYLRPGKTITVEEDAVMSVSGTLYMDGSIVVKPGGTLILQKNACIQPLGRENPSSRESPGDSIQLDGGNLLLLQGSRLLSGVFGRGLVSGNGATIVNCGTIIQSNTTVFSSTNIENRETGLFVTGLTPDITSLASFASFSIANSGTVVGTFDGASVKSGMCVMLDSNTSFINDGTLSIFSTFSSRGAFSNNGQFFNTLSLATEGMPATGSNTGTGKA